jgi:glycerophosphoryl diester phosphodiesterase
MVDVGPLDSQAAIECLVTAHRGAPIRSQDGLGALPDNSIPALRESVAQGVPLVEVDVRRSNEGDLFLFHDGSLSSSNSFSPSTLHGVPIAQLTRQERSLAKLDAAGEISIPILDEALTVISDSRTTLQIDLKGESDELAFSVVELVAKRGLLRNVLFQIRSADRAYRIFQRYPQARVLLRCLNQKALEEALSLGVEFVELERWASSAAIRMAHARTR